jgi:hypothetical protein
VAIERSIAGALLAASVVAAALVSPAHASDVRRTLARTHDPVIVPGAALAALPIRDTAALDLHRFEAGRAVPIRFQIDQRDEEGEIVVDGPRDFALDANDELVFMAKDAGDRTIADPCPAGCVGALEIEVDDPLTGESAWVYLAAHRKPPSDAVLEPYVTFDADLGEARSPYYRVDYARGRNYFTGVRVAETAGGKNVNLLRQSRMHGSPTFSLLVTDFTLDFTEQNSIVEVDGIRSGPVRAVRRARLSVDLGPLFPELPSGTAYTYHYLTSYLTPTRVKFPWLMLKTLRAFRFENVLDFEPAAMPMRYYDADNPQGVSLTSTDAEIHATDDHEWWVHSGAAGTILHAFVIPEVWREWGVVRGTVVRPADGEDDTDAADAEPDPSHTAAGRAAGYTLLNMTSLREAGSFDLLMASVVLPGPFRPGDESAPMAMVRAPLVTTVRRVR